MNLLYFAPHQLWPLVTGARLRDYHLARQLAARCAVTFVEMRHPGDADAAAPADSGFARIVTTRKGSGYGPATILRGMAGPAPVTVLNYSSRKVARRLAQTLKTDQFQAVQVENVHLSGYLPVIQSAATRPSVVLDWHNVESELMWRYSEGSIHWLKRLAARRTAVLLERLENRLLAGSLAHTVSSDREYRILSARRPSAAIHVVPNGVDTAYYSRVAPVGADQSNARRRLLFVGSMDYHANVDAMTWFVREIWPELRQQHEDLEFVIAGRNPGPGIRALDSGERRVRVTGTVDDVRPFYAESDAVVVPLRVGSGTRLKILEAMAAGVPVISTRLGAEGIDAVDNVHLLLADSAQQIVSAVGHILASPEKRIALVEAARALVCTRYDWSVIGERLFRIHCEHARRP